MGFFTSKAPSYKYLPYGNLSPVQKETALQTGGFLQNGFPSYTGELAADMTQGEKDLVSQSSRLTALSEPTWSALLNPLDESGMLQKSLDDYYTNTIYRPAWKTFTEETVPYLNEEYAGTGAFNSSARVDALRRGARDLTDSLAAQKSKLGWEALMNAGNAATQYGNFSSQMAERQALPRLVQQNKLDKEYDEWLRTVPGGSQWLDAALNFMQIPMAKYEYQPGEASTFSKIAPILGTVAGAGLGAWLGPLLSGTIGQSLLATQAPSWISGALGGAALGGGLGSAIGNVSGGQTADIGPLLASLGNFQSSMGADAYRRSVLDALYSRGNAMIDSPSYSGPANISEWAAMLDGWDTSDMGSVLDEYQSTQAPMNQLTDEDIQNWLKKNPSGATNSSILKALLGLI